MKFFFHSLSFPLNRFNFNRNISKRSCIQPLGSTFVSSLSLKPNLKLFTDIRCLSMIDKSFSHYQEKFRRMDGISNDYELIYRLSSPMWYVVSTPISLFSMLLGPIFYISQHYGKHWFSDLSSSDFLQEFVVRSIPSLTSVHYFSYAALLFLSSTHYIFMIRYPLRVYYNGDQYIAIYMHRLLPGFKTQKYSFVSVKKALIPSITSLPMFWCGKRKTKLCLDSFRTPYDYFLMTGEEGQDTFTED